MTIGNRYRITILTSRLIRMEYQRNGIFVDEATQAVVNRKFPSVEYSTLHEKGRLIIETDDLIFSYDGEEFSPEGLSIEVKATGNVWHYS
ncbi:MAG: alpha-xylosidase, partial [Pseudobutyrivibrio sp.]|nr:alpha-xylosidase [Pseudobutyrivibrio sp.]